MAPTGRNVAVLAAFVFLAPNARGLDAPPPRKGRCPPAVEMPRAWPEEWAAQEHEAAALLNRVRTEGTLCRGRRRRPVPPLVLDARLRESARRQTRYMATHRVWAHDVAGCDPFTWMGDAGYEATALAQNLGRRTGRNSAALAVSSWVASGQGHCETLMDPRWRSMGVAYVRAGREHLWTVNFGDR